MLNAVEKCFEVIGVTRGDEYCLRRFLLEDDAIQHALKADMGVWDDIFVRPANKIIPRQIDGPPPFPWTVEWTSSFAYVLDASGHRIASLLGPQKQREYVAEILMGLGKQ